MVKSYHIDLRLKFTKQKFGIVMFKGTSKMFFKYKFQMGLCLEIQNGGHRKGGKNNTYYKK